MISYSWGQVVAASKQRDGLLALYIYRPVAHILTFLIANYVGLSPNAISIMSFMSHAGAAACIWLGLYYVSAALIFLGFTLDCVDGNIARLFAKQSTRGKLLDIALDRIAFLMLLISLAFQAHFPQDISFRFMYVSIFLALENITAAIAYHIAAATKLSVHSAPPISSFTGNIQRILGRVVPFIMWDRVIIGLGADQWWTALIICSLIQSSFIIILQILISLLALYLLFLCWSVVTFSECRNADKER